MWYKLTQAQIADFEKRCCYNAIVWIVKNRHLGDGKYVLNVKTGKKVDIDTISYEDFNTEEYPFLGITMGKLNTSGGYTKVMHAFYESTDGFWYCKAQEDELNPGKDATFSRPAYPDLTVPKSSFYNDTIHSGTVTEMPEFVEN